MDELLLREIKKYAQETEKRRRAIWFLALWLACVVIIFVPGGIISQTMRAVARYESILKKTTMGLCYRCGQPATHSAVYGGYIGVTYCAAHSPPDQWLVGARTQSLSEWMISDDKWVLLLTVVILVYCLNCLRVIVHIRSSGLWFKPTFQGAIIGTAVLLGLWAWLSSRFLT